MAKRKPTFERGGLTTMGRALRRIGQWEVQLRLQMLGRQDTGLWIALRSKGTKSINTQERGI